VARQLSYFFVIASFNLLLLLACAVSQAALVAINSVAA
jgi:hypothetical protein